MAITRIGAAAADASTVTIPAGHKIGDLLVIFAFRATTVAPSLPAGWTSISTGSSGLSSFILGWKLATSSADTSGSWSLATGTIVHVYRGTSTSRTPVGVSSDSTATSATIAYGALGPLKQPGTSWLAAFAVTKTTTSTLETPPTSMTNAATLVGGTVEYAGHDTNGPYTAGAGSWPLTNVAVGVSAEYRTCVLEIYAEQGLNNNYQQFDVGNGMSTSEKIK
jgi:hypothetical protein